MHYAGHCYIMFICTVAWFVCLFTLFVMTMSPAKNGGTDQRNFMGAYLCGSQEPHITWLHIGATWQIRLNNPCSVGDSECCYQFTLVYQLVIIPMHQRQCAFY